MDNYGIQIEKLTAERDEWRSRFEALDQLTTSRIDTLWREQQWLAGQVLAWMKRFNGELDPNEIGVIVPTLEEMMIEAERAVSPPDDDEDDDSESLGGGGLGLGDNATPKEATDNDPKLSDCGGRAQPMRKGGGGEGGGSMGCDRPEQFAAAHGSAFAVDSEKGGAS